MYMFIIIIKIGIVKVKFFISLLRNTWQKWRV